VEGVAVGGRAVGTEVTVARGTDVGTVVAGWATTGVAAAGAPQPEARRQKITKNVYRGLRACILTFL
jgi:hypothetical protein